MAVSPNPQRSRAEGAVGPRCWLLTFAWLSASCVITAAPVHADDPAAADRLAKYLIDRVGAGPGLCAMIGRDGALPLRLVQSSKWLVHVRDPRLDSVADLRGRADETGIGIDRLVVEHGTLQRLPFADHLVDTVLATTASPGLLEQLSAHEVLRALRPQGTALIGKSLASAGGDVSVAQLQQWAAGVPAENVRAWQDEAGTWITLTKPPLAGADEWTHWEKGPDNNPVSNDAAIQAPYMTQFMAEPLYIGMPSITTAAGGRTFLAIGHIAHHRREWNMLYKLIARNGYNGTVLWTKDLPDGYQVHRSAFIATGDTFYRSTATMP